MRPTNRACASAMLFVLVGKGNIVIATTSPSEFMIHAPKPEGPGLPLGAPSKFNFQYPSYGGLYPIFLRDNEEVEELRIFQPSRMNKCFHL